MSLPAVVCDGESSPASPCGERNAIRASTFKRFLGLPIKIGEETVGMIGLANKEEDYSEEDAQFLQPLLDTLGALFYALEVEKSRLQAEQKLRYLGRNRRAD